MKALAAITALAVLAGCQVGGPDGIPTSPQIERLLSLVSGDDQTGVPGEPLESPLVVRVHDVRGTGLAGIRVRWTVESGSGSFSSGTTVTGSDGLAAVSFTPSTERVVDLLAEIEGWAGAHVVFRVAPRGTVYYDRLSPSSSDYEVLVFYPDNSFQFRHGPAFKIPGTYGRDGSILSLVFANSSYAATATIRGDSLRVEYNADATMADFGDATFLLKQGEPPLR